jgi:hypothetical protein
LDSIHPLSLIETAVEPVHFPVPTAHISFIIAFVAIAALPGELSIAPLLIVLVAAFIFVTVSRAFLPEAFSLP